MLRPTNYNATSYDLLSTMLRPTNYNATSYDLLSTMLRPTIYLLLLTTTSQIRLRQLGEIVIDPLTGERSVLASP
jgi:hypothetical protein